MASAERVQRVAAFGSSVDEDANSNHASYSNQNVTDNQSSRATTDRALPGYQSQSETSLVRVIRGVQESNSSRLQEHSGSLSSAGGDSGATMMTSAYNMPVITPGGVHEGGAAGNKMTSSTSSLTDLTLEQAVMRIQEIERENIALRDNLRHHNGVVKQQYEALAEWRKKESEKFEQTKALITALRNENQELQVQGMAYTDKEKELYEQIQALEEEKGHLQRQKAMSDQRVINVYKKAEEQGIDGLTKEDLEAESDYKDAMVYVSATGKEKTIEKLESAVASKEENIAQLRAEVLKKDQEVAKFRETTKQLLKDMESQQRLKEGIEEENRMLTKQIMQAEQKLHKQMQSVIATTKREMQAEQMFTTATLSPNTSATHLGAAAAAATDDSESRNLSFRENVEDLMNIAKSLEAKEQEEMTVARLKTSLQEAEKEKETVKESAKVEIEKLTKELEKMTTTCEEMEKESQEAKQQLIDRQDKLAQEYEEKLMAMAKHDSRHGSQPFQASETEDMSILRSQVLTLIKEVDEAQNKLSAAMAALKLKDDRIRELDMVNQNLQSEYNSHWQETHSLIRNLRLQLANQQMAQQENSQIKHQYAQLQESFSTLVTDYKELQETFERYRKQMEQQAASPQQPNRETMEEINRLTAQVYAADEAIALRDEQLAQLKSQLNSDSRHDEEIQLLKFQADLYQSDFAAEREGRTKLAEEKMKLEEELRELQAQNRALVEEMDGYNQRQISDMQRRLRGSSGNWDSPDRLRATPPLAQDYNQQRPQNHRSPPPSSHQANNPQAQNPPTAAGAAVREADDEEDLQSFQQFDCPTCDAKFPDYDSLQLHVPDCMDNIR